MRVEDFSTRVVRAVPVDISIAAVQFVSDPNPAVIDHWEPLDAEDEVVGIVFTAGTFAALAEEWGDLDAWMEAVSGKVEMINGIETVIEKPKNPLGAIVKTLAIVLHRVPDAVGAAVSMASIPEYTAGLLAAMQIAQGVDPTNARRIGQRIAGAKVDPNVGVEEELNRLDSLLTPGAGTGADQVETSNGSGT